MAENRQYVFRTDTFDVERKRFTPEGFLEISGTAALRGPLQYGERTEFVTDDALQDTENLRAAVVVLEHPDTPDRKVTPKNFREFARGSTIEARYDTATGRQFVRLRVTDQEAIDSIMAREAIQLSPGYEVEIDPTPGVDEDTGTRFDARQVKRVVNHIALTSAGRAGPKASLRVDSQNEDEMPDVKEGAEKPEKSAELEAEKAKNEALQARIDALEEKLAEKQEEDEEQSRQDSFLSMYQRHKEACAVAERFGVEVDADADTTAAVQRKVVQKALGDRYDSEKADEHIAVQFEILAAQAPEKPEKKEKARHDSVVNAFVPSKTEEASPQRADSQESPEEAWRRNFSRKRS